MKRILPLIAILAGICQTAPAASHTWQGSAVSTLWSYAPNWSSGVAPTAGETALELVFPAAPVQKTNVDDIPNLKVDTITVDGGNYIFQGLGGVSLTFSGTRGFNFIAQSSNAQVNIIHSSLPLVLAATTRFNTDSKLAIDSVISGPGGLDTYGNLSLQGTAANTYLGTTTASAGGNLTLGKSNGVSCFAGPLTADGGVIENGAFHQIPDSVTVTLKNNGHYNSKTSLEKIGPLVFDGGVIHSIFDGLTLGGDVSVLGGSTNEIGSFLSLGGPNRIFNVAPGAVLTLYANIADDAGVSSGFTKTGLGELRLIGTSSFTGDVTISEGTCRAGRDGALGSTTGGTFVSYGANLQLTSGLTISEPLTLKGTLSAIGADNRWTGPVQVPFPATLNMTYFDSSLVLSGVISGNGSLDLTGSASAVIQFSGSQANTMTGPVVVKSGNLLLNKTLVSAINGALTIQSDAPAVPAVVRYLQPHQLADGAVVTLGDSLLNELNFDGNSDTIGSLAGGGTVKLGSATLTTGGNNTSTEFHGVITGTASGGLTKNGSGTFTINPAPVAGQPPAPSTYSGVTQINNGTLLVNGKQSGPFQVNGGFLGGSGSVGHISLLAGGHLCLCTLTTQGITGTGAANEIRADLTSPNNIQHITMAGALSLNNTVLKVSLFYQPQFGTEFILIANDGVDPVQGNFLGLPNGSNFTISGKPFTIFYNGGDGNDVSVIYKGPSPVPVKILSMNYNPATNTVNLLGLGDPGQVYDWQRSLDLVTWTQAGTVTANVLGVINGDFVNGLFKPDRLFYRLVLP